MENIQNERVARTWIPSKIIISEAIIIAGLTAIAYLAAFANQYSYLSYFGVPWSFIDINLGTVLFITLALALWLSLLIFSFGYLSTFNEGGPRGFAKKIGVGIVYFVEILIPYGFVVYDPTSLRHTLAWLGFLVTLFIVFMISIISDKEKPKTLLDGIIDGIEKKHGTFFVILLLFSIFFLVGSYSLGSILAKEKDNFLTIGRNSNQAVITTYSGNLIAVSFSTSTKTFNNEISLISLDKISTDGITLVNEKIGPLIPLAQ